MPRYYIRITDQDRRAAFLAEKFVEQLDFLAERKTDLYTEETRAVSAPFVYQSTIEPDLVIAELSDEEAEQLKNEGIEITPTLTYRPAAGLSIDFLYPPCDDLSKGLDDVLRQIKADQAHLYSRGKNVNIAIVDSGICGSRAEFPAWKKSPLSFGFDSLWIDNRPHGSMVACIAAATKSEGGKYDGVAPDAKILSCKVPSDPDFDEAHLIPIYEDLIKKFVDNRLEPLVINNSYCLGTATVPPPTPFIDRVRQAVGLGIVVVFAAGNNRVVNGTTPPCGPNTIYGANAMDEVITVGTVDENNHMNEPLPPCVADGMSHRNGSRGPGQSPFTILTTKPDCVAPTYGEVMWNCGDDFKVWWGTSGAAPQISGLAALLLEKQPDLTPADVKRIIKETCTDIGLPETCAGAGLINCLEAVRRVT